MASSSKGSLLASAPAPSRAAMVASAPAPATAATAMSAPAPSPSEEEAEDDEASSSSEKLSSEELFERGLARKQQEVDLLEKKHAELFNALGTMEEEMEGLAALLVKKDAELRGQQRDLDASKAEVKRLLMLQSNMDGKDEAIKVATQQNQTILIALQQADHKCKELVVENTELRAELRRQSHFSDKRIRRSATQNERLRSALKYAEREITVATLSNESHKRRAEVAEQRASEARAHCDAEVSLVTDELRSRKERQYLLTSKLINAGDAARAALDDLERKAEEMDLHQQTRAALEQRLEEAYVELDDREQERIDAAAALLQEKSRAMEAEERSATAHRTAVRFKAALEALVDDQTQQEARLNEIRIRTAQRVAKQVSDQKFENERIAQRCHILTAASEAERRRDEARPRRLDALEGASTTPRGL